MGVAIKVVGMDKCAEELTIGATEGIGQGVTFHAGLQILPVGNLGISQKIQPMCPVGPFKIVSEGGKHTLNYYISNSLGLQMT